MNNLLMKMSEKWMILSEANLQVDVDTEQLSAVATNLGNSQKRVEAEIDNCFELDDIDTEGF